MRNIEQQIFALDNFEGPLDFLFHLIQKNEVDIYEISLTMLTDQFFLKLKDPSPSQIESGAEFIGTLASLMLLKSKMLLPKHEQLDNALIDEESDPRFEIIHQLIDYCRFKDAAKTLAEREERQGAFYERGMDDEREPQKPLGIEHISLNDLAALFQTLLTNAASHKGLIHEETFRVADKISFIRQLLKDLKKIQFNVLFSSEHSREELIVSFLAILELMKLGEVCVVKDTVCNEVMIIPQ
jgi:segregation and condensation protein A